MDSETGKDVELDADTSSAAEADGIAEDELEQAPGDEATLIIFLGGTSHSISSTGVDVSSAFLFARISSFVASRRTGSGVFMEAAGSGMEAAAVESWSEEVLKPFGQRLAYISTSFS